MNPRRLHKLTIFSIRCGSVGVVMLGTSADTVGRRKLGVGRWALDVGRWTFRSRKLWSLLDGDFGLDRVRDETFGVREVVHLVEFLFSRLFLAGKLQLGMQFHPRDRHLAVLVFLHVTDGIIGVFVEHKLLFAGDGEERKHVAAPARSDKRFLRIDIFRIPEKS